MCGLCGFAPTKKAEIDILKFKSLLLSNEDRGKLSTGIYSTNGLDKDIISASDFAEKQEWNELDKSSIFIGHTRQPTAGYPVTMHGAQPIEIGNVVVIHNGTIYNVSELAKKYNVEVDVDDTDSIVMAKILEGKQFGVLDDYNGAATLIWVYKDEPDNIYYYRGMSKVLDNSLDMTNERPLFQMKTKEGIYFSSIKKSLIHISLSQEQIHSIKEVKANTVFKLNINKINTPKALFKTVDTRTQTKVYKIKQTYTNNDDKNKTRAERREDLKHARRQTQIVIDYAKDEVEGYVENDNGIYVPESYAKDSKEDEKLVTLEIERTNVIHKLENQEDHAFKYIFNTPQFLNLEDEEINSNMVNPNMVYYNKGRYWINDVPANGTYNLSIEGVVAISGKAYAFIEGILLKDKSREHWQTIVKNLDKNRYIFGYISFAALLCKHSEQPVPYFSYRKERTLVFGKKGKAFTGMYCPLFLTRGNYDFIEGDYMGLFNKEVVVTDIVITKFKEHVVVTELVEGGFRGYQIEDSDKEVSFFNYSWVLDVIPQTCTSTKEDDIEEAEILDAEDFKLLAEINDISEIAFELVNHLNEASHKLAFYKDNNEAQSFLEIIADFKENKLAM